MWICRYVGMGFDVPCPHPQYPSGAHLLPFTYPWVKLFYQTLTLTGKNPLGMRVMRTHCHRYVSCKAVPNIVGDSIIAVRPKELYLAQRNLNGHTWSQAADGCIGKRGLSIPYSLIYHIFTCCHRASW